jgi:hypothetical protein
MAAYAGGMPMPTNASAIVAVSTARCRTGRPVISVMMAAVSV